MMANVHLKNITFLRCEICGGESETKVLFIEHIKSVHQHNGGTNLWTQPPSNKTCEDRPKINRQTAIEDWTERKNLLKVVERPKIEDQRNLVTDQSNVVEELRNNEDINKNKKNSQTFELIELDCEIDDPPLPSDSKSFEVGTRDHCIVLYVGTNPHVQTSKHKLRPGTKNLKLF